MSLKIEICISNGQSNTDKGNILEKLASDILAIQQYEITDQIRLTGMEVDVLAKHKVNGSVILVECKAHEDSLPADTISKLLGNVFIRNATAGWLITTGPLTKDAEGSRIEWENRSIEERQKMSFYTSNRILDLLIDAKLIVNPDTIRQDAVKDYSIAEDTTLIIISGAMYWIIPVVDKNTSFVTSVIAYNAKTGDRITNNDTLTYIKSHKNSYSDYQWLSNSETNETKILSDDIANEYNNIVQVISGDDWIDYRPARPEDFVGRQAIINDTISFLESVNNGHSPTRLFSIKAPSGMGKSSLVLKISSKLSNHRYTKRFFVYSVDVRTATSSRYVEMALKLCFDTADRNGFTDTISRSVEMTNINQYLESTSIQTTLEYLKSNNKTIVLIFDQFEELFSKRELFPLFDNFKSLCNKIDALQGQIVLGFAWKTDLTIPGDHPAYYMWSNLSDRRKEFELTQFKDSEIKSAINIFGKQLGENINPILRSYLTKQCQGYPWLLKKLCIHVFKMIKDGRSQDSVIGQRLNIQDLFDKDISELTPDQHACLKEIAKNSPADYFAIAEIYSDDMIQTLVNNRLVIRRASKLTLYWDIFRDYVLNNTIPTLVHEYIPQSQPFSVYEVINQLIDAPESTIEDIAKKLSKNVSTIENITIDMVMFGIINKNCGFVNLLYNNEEEIVCQLQSFFKKHILYQKMLQERNGFNYGNYIASFNDIYSNNNFSSKTKNSYCSKLYSWFINLGLFYTDNGAEYAVANPSFKQIKLSNKNKSSRRTRYTNSTNLFLGQTSNKKIEKFYELINNNNNDYNMLLSEGYRNAIELLSSIQAIRKKADNTIIITKSLEQVYNEISNSFTITYTLQLLRDSPYMHGIDIGHAISEKTNRDWSESSKRRYGCALMKWAKFISSRNNE